MSDWPTTKTRQSYKQIKGLQNCVPTKSGCFNCLMNLLLRLMLLMNGTVKGWMAQYIIHKEDKYIIPVSQTASPKGRTIRKVMGGGVLACQNFLGGPFPVQESFFLATALCMKFCLWENIFLIHNLLLN